MARSSFFQRATVTRIVKESVDARTFVLAPHDGPIAYRAGQFCTFRVPVDGTALFRSYSMSSAPETDDELMTTVKRVPGGKVSNWMLDNLAEGDELQMSRAAAGRFCLRETDVPLLGFSGGSGITPILSLTKCALASTQRRIRLLCADRDADAVIFGTVLAELARTYPDRLEVVRHLDADRGFLDAAAIRAFVGDDGHADHYICGPEPFMEMVELALPGPGLVFSERFGAPAPAASTTQPSGTTTVSDSAATTSDPAGAGTVTITLNRKKKTVPRKQGETLLESARRAGLSPPFSCEQGNCATCIARVTKGSASLRHNDALTDDELADGYVLTCQAVPDTETISVDYD
ncbi:ferredoxin--NADP reductase [Nocardia wallacei]|uniref:ferredoxin--NADP reductase n=1 Tax=Nocardia wallacei TaxID=480035 RepID=UPI002454D50A|nr:ferredoxin--NADP reductase [Nocardia wallacei]